MIVGVFDYCCCFFFPVHACIPCALHIMSQWQAIHVCITDVPCITKASNNVNIIILFVQCGICYLHNLIYDRWFFILPFSVKINRPTSTKSTSVWLTELFRVQQITELA